MTSKVVGFNPLHPQDKSSWHESCLIVFHGHLSNAEDPPVGEYLGLWCWALIGQLWSRDPNAGLWLVQIPPADVGKTTTN